MALFRRTQAPDSKEAKKYYEAERKERSGMAWLLAVASIASVALVLIGLFYGGRWVYRSVTDTETNEFTEQVQTSPVSTNEDTNTENTDAPAPNSSGDTATSSAQTTVPSQTSTTLVNTGMSGTFATFVVIAVVATGLYQLRLRSDF